MDKLEIYNNSDCIVDMDFIEEAEQVQGVEHIGPFEVYMAWDSFADCQRAEMKKFRGTKTYMQHCFTMNMVEPGADEEIELQVSIYTEIEIDPNFIEE